MSSESKVVVWLVVASVVILGILLWVGGKNGTTTTAVGLPSAVADAVSKNDKAYPVGDLVNASDYQEGNATAPVTLVEFADFECPVCDTFYSTLQELRAKYTNEQLRIVYRLSPLVEIHNEALPSARAAQAAFNQGKFAEYAKTLYKDQPSLGEALYVKIATELGLNMDQFNKDRATDQTAWLAYRARNYMTQQQWDLQTPTLIFNGVRYEGSRDLDSLVAKVNSLLPTK